jgi:transposase
MAGDLKAVKSETRIRLMDRKIVELLIQKKSQREIKKILQIGQRRVQKITAIAEEYGYLSGEVSIPPYPEALFPDRPDARGSKSSEADELLLRKKDWILDRLQALWHPITIHEELGLNVGRSSFYRFLHRHSLYEIGRASRLRVVPEIIHQPGEALILDWGKLRDVIDPDTGKKRTLWAFVGVLGFSRYLMVRLVWSNSAEITLQAIESMLQEIGGTPFKMTSDNPKCFSLEASRYEPILNPALERFASYYKFLIECLPPADPEKKGKVERMMPFVRRLYEGHGTEWKGTEESQTYLNRKLVMANERIHGTTRKKPIDQLINIEVTQLKPLPPMAYSPEEILEVKVRADGHVRFNNKYYSLPENLIRESVMILASQKEISIYHKGKLIEVHPRISSENCLHSKSTKEHHKKPWERAMNDHSLYRTRAQAIGPDCDQFVLTLLKQGQGFIDTRKIWGILSLDKTHSTSLINDACRQAIALDSYSYQTVKRLLKLLKIEKSPVADSTPAESKTTHKFVRPMSVYEEQLKLLLH